MALMTVRCKDKKKYFEIILKPTRKFPRLVSKCLFHHEYATGLPLYMMHNFFWTFLDL